MQTRKTNPDKNGNVHYQKLITKKYANTNTNTLIGRVGDSYDKWIFIKKSEFDKLQRNQGSGTKHGGFIGPVLGAISSIFLPKIFKVAYTKIKGKGVSGGDIDYLKKAIVGETIRQSIDSMKQQYDKIPSRKEITDATQQMGIQFEKLLKGNGIYRPRGYGSKNGGLIRRPR